MREIKFRAFDKTNKEMVFSEIPPSFSFWKYVAFDSDCLKTLMQFTGLRDKNGVEIYEGDVVKENKFPHEDLIYKVIWGGHWKYAGFGLETNKPNYPRLEPFSWDVLNPEMSVCIEVIGNIYENLNLITQQRTTGESHP